MAPKKGRARSSQVAQTAAATRTRRGAPPAYGNNVTVEAIGTAREGRLFDRQTDGTIVERGERSTRGRGRGSGHARGRGRASASAGVGAGAGANAQQGTGEESGNATSHSEPPHEPGSNIPGTNGNTGQQQQAGAVNQGAEQDNATSDQQNSPPGGDANQIDQQTSGSGSAKGIGQSAADPPDATGPTTSASGQEDDDQKADDEETGDHEAAGQEIDVQQPAGEQSDGEQSDGRHTGDHQPGSQQIDSQGQEAGGQSEQTTGEQSQEDQPKDDTVAGGEGKRRRSSDGSKPESPKKQKTKDDGEGNGKQGEGDKEMGAGLSSGQGQRQDQQGGEKESCLRLREFLRERGPVGAITSSERYHNPVTVNQPMENHHIYRAFGSVTEAITALGRVSFSLMDETTLIRGEAARGTFMETVGRPGHEMLVLLLQDHHHSLIALRQVDGTNDQYRMLHFDSAGLLHRHNIATHYETVRSRLLNAQWDGQGTSRPQITGYETHQAARQNGGAECGPYTIFNAWAFALGLRVSGRVERPLEFRTRGANLIRLAVRGELGASTIRDFLDCHGFIEPDQQVPPERNFEQTTAFLTDNSVAEHLARVRIEDGIPPDWNLTLPMILEMLGNDAPRNLTEISPEQFIAHALFFLGTGAGQTQGIASQGGTSEVPPAAGPSAGASSAAQDGQSAGAGDIDESGTHAQSGEGSGQAGEGPGSGGTTVGQTSIGMNSTAHDQPDAPQSDGLQEGSGPSSNMQNGDAPGQSSSGPPAHGTQQSQDPTQANETSQGDGAPPPDPSSSPTGQGPATTGDEQQPQRPRTTALLASIPNFMRPEHPDHAEFTQRRQAAREEALRHVQNAQAAAAGLAPPHPPSPPPPPPPTASTQAPTGNGADTNTEANNQQDEGDDETIQGETEEYVPPPADETSEGLVETPSAETPAGGAETEEVDYGSLFGEDEDFDAGDPEDGLDADDHGDEDEVDNFECGDLYSNDDS